MENQGKKISSHTSDLFHILRFDITKTALNPSVSKRKVPVYPPKRLPFEVKRQCRTLNTKMRNYLLYRIFYAYVACLPENDSDSRSVFVGLFIPCMNRTYQGMSSRWLGFTINLIHNCTFHEAFHHKIFCNLGQDRSQGNRS